MEKIIDRKSGFLIDWFTCTFHDVSLDTVRDILGLNDYHWEDNFKYINGYPKYLSFGNINIRYGCEDPANYGGDESKTRTDMGICLDMSGTGCRSFESFSAETGLSWIDFFLNIMELSLDHRINITRIDLSYDDFDGLLDILDVASDVLARNFTGPAKTTKVLFSDDQLKDVQGCTCYIGSEKSSVRLRIYDKLAERIAADDSINSVEDSQQVKDEICSWIRVELVLRDDRASSAFDLLLEHKSIGFVMLGVLRNYCVFRVPSADTNKSRWEIAPYWDAFLAKCEKIRLWSAPGLPYDVVKSTAWLTRQYGQLLLTLHKTNIYGGLKGVVDDAEKMHPKLGKKYQKIVDDMVAREELAKKKLAEERQRIYDQYAAVYAWLLDAGVPSDDFESFISSLIK